jgi:hypothetical protein
MSREMSVKALNVLQGNCPDVCKEKKKIFVFSAARFIISEWLMTRNYPDIITYVFL